MWQLLRGYLTNVAALGGGGAPPLPSISSVTIDNTTPTVGDVLTATVTGSNIDTITYAWKADGTPIGGETASTYTTTRADAMGRAITVVATGHNSSGAGSPAESDPTDLVTGAPVNTVAPVATPATVSFPSGTFNTTDGAWTGYPSVTFTYLWIGSIALGGASPKTNNSYTTDAGDPPQDVHCAVTGTNSVGFLAADSNTVQIV